MLDFQSSTAFVNSCDFKVWEKFFKLPKQTHLQRSLTTRYLPADEPQPGQSFNLPGIYLKVGVKDFKVSFFVWSHLWRSICVSPQNASHLTIRLHSSRLCSMNLSISLPSVPCLKIKSSKFKKAQGLEDSPFETVIMAGDTLRRVRPQIKLMKILLI